MGGNILQIHYDVPYFLFIKIDICSVYNTTAVLFCFIDIFFDAPYTYLKIKILVRCRVYCTLGPKGKYRHSK